MPAQQLLPEGICRKHVGSSFRRECGQWGDRDFKRDRARASRGPGSVQRGLEYRKKKSRSLREMQRCRHELSRNSGPLLQLMPAGEGLLLVSLCHLHGQALQVGAVMHFYTEAGELYSECQGELRRHRQCEFQQHPKRLQRSGRRLRGCRARHASIHDAASSLRYCQHQFFDIGVPMNLGTDEYVDRPMKVERGRKLYASS